MEVSLIKKQLKKSSFKTIIERTNCSKTLVYDILKGERITSPNRDFVISISLDVLAEQKEAENQLKLKFSKVLANE